MLDLLQLGIHLGRVMVVIAKRAHEMIVRHRSLEWPLGTGTVELRQVVDVDDRKPFAAELLYSYEVAGQFYSGEHRFRFKKEKEAEQKVLQYPSGTVVPIRYNPKKPCQSVMITEF